ncbi:MAG: hypothetical protein RXR06_03880 [Thermoproteus sp.]
MFPRYSVRCPVCNAVVELPYDSRYSELARKSPDGLYARVVRCPNGHLITVHIDGDGTLRRIGSGDAARGKDCELVGDAGFLPLAVRRRVEEALRSGDYRGVEEVIEDLKRMGVVRCL